MMMPGSLLLVLLFRVIPYVVCDNNWSSWSKWSECSVECGGGVRKQSRICLQIECLGDSVRYAVCNPQPCDDGSVSPRDYMCGRLSGAYHHGIKVEWVAIETTTDPCALYCRAIGHNIMAKMAKKVPDGFWCSSESSGMCVAGKCVNIGCDGILGSDKREDECGICGGNGETCDSQRYFWEENMLSACSVTCGVGRQTTSFYCKDIRKDKRVKTKFCDKALKPKKKDVKCEMRACKASWLLDVWQPCSHKCGAGTKSRNIRCVYLQPDGNHSSLSDHICPQPPPPTTKPCHRRHCPKWKVTKWSNCSIPCGTGIAYRKVMCSSKSRRRCDESIKPVDSRPCKNKDKCPDGYINVPSNNIKNKMIPLEFSVVDGMIGDQAQNAQPTHETGWKVGLLGPCSATCGPGIQIRTWECRITDLKTNQYKVLPNHNCIVNPRPPDLQSCHITKCPKETYEKESDNEIRDKIQYLWRYSGFKPCSASCLGGQRTAVVECVRDIDRKRVRDHYCDLDRKPSVVARPCNEVPCPPSWHLGQWSQCGVTCGSGTQKRFAECVEEISKNPNKSAVHPAEKCRKPYPETFRKCKTLDCPAVWIAGRWLKCTPACGRGMKMREVQCEQTLFNGTTVTHWGPAELKCPSVRPDAWKACKNTKCLSQNRLKRPPKIFEDSTAFIQTKRKTSLKLIVGGTNVVIPGTSIVLRCPVKYYRRKKLVWTKNGKKVSYKGRVRQTKKGVLKILRSRPRDAGVYTCIAGKTMSNSTLEFHSVHRGNKMFKYRKSYLQKRANMLNVLSSTAAQKAKNGKFLLSDAWDSNYNYSLTPYHYVVSKWGLCSTSCNGTGIQERKVSCEVIMEEYFRKVEVRLCEQAGIQMPPATKPCGFSECPHWEAGIWQKACPHNCVRYHMAMQKRPMTCLYNNATTTSLDRCSDVTKPNYERMCVNVGCSPVWLLSQWSTCSKTCGGRGIQSRALHCVWRNSEQPAGMECKSMARPAVVKPCYTVSCEPSCMDRTTYCGLIKMLKLCRYAQYKNICCKTCT